MKQIQFPAFVWRKNWKKKPQTQSQLEISYFPNFNQPSACKEGKRHEAVMIYLSHNLKNMRHMQARMRIVGPTLETGLELESVLYKLVQREVVMEERSNHLPFVTRWFATEINFKTSQTRTPILTIVFVFRNKWISLLFLWTCFAGISHLIVFS